MDETLMFLSFPDWLKRNQMREHFKATNHVCRDECDNARNPKRDCLICDLKLSRQQEVVQQYQREKSAAIQKIQKWNSDVHGSREESSASGEAARGSDA